MKPRLKPLNQQVIVITGASSGIGLATAKIAAAQGAKVVLAARDEPSLRRAVEAIHSKGGTALYVAADIAQPEAVERIAAAAIEAYGGFDTWMNIAGVSIYGMSWDIPPDDARRLFDVNYWGVVHGSLKAVEQLRRRGGALINLGSITSDRAVPLQGHYSASKHAVKGFTDALRMEVEKAGFPIVVTLVKPSSIATPFVQHAKSYMEVEPTLPPPVYAPEVVAAVLLECAQRPHRAITVGGGGRLLTALGAIMPRLTDRLMEVMLFRQQKTNHPTDGRETNLHAPAPGSGRERGAIDRHVMRSSLYTRLALRPGVALAGLAGLALVAALAASL